MTQRELNRAVARATGEELTEIRRRGFSVMRPRDDNFDPEPNDFGPQVIDWDAVEAERYLPIVPRRSALHAA